MPGEFPMAPQVQGTPTAASPGVKGPAIDDDASDLLQRIQGAIPDLQTLLHRYEATSGQLGLRDRRLQEIEALKSEEVQTREARIQHLTKELDDARIKHEAECNTLRLTVGNLEEKYKEVMDNLAAEKDMRGELQVKHNALEDEIRKLQSDWEDDKVSMKRDHAAREQKIHNDLLAKQKAHEDSHHRNQDNEARLRDELQQEKKLRIQEVEALRNSQSRMKKELEESHFRRQQDLEETLKQTQGALAESRKKHIEAMETWDKERADLGQSPEEQRKALEESHQAVIATIDREHETKIMRQQRNAEDEKAVLHKEIESLKARCENDDRRFERTKEELNNSITNIANENTRLRKLADTFGEVTDLKSKGDTY